ncbi:MAG: hypothetical protein CME32_01235 [Gimesia sp.]|nr:hypothetical protein [Gimesia sp.]
MSEYSEIYEEFFDAPTTNFNGVSYGNVAGRRVCLVDLAVCQTDRQTNLVGLTAQRIKLFREAACEKIPVVIWFSGDTDTSQTKVDPSAGRLFLDAEGGIGALYAAIASCAGRTTLVSILTGAPRHSRSFPFALSDICIFVRDATISLGKDDLVNLLLKEENNPAFYGYEFHSKVTGLADMEASDVSTAFQLAKQYLLSTVENTDIQSGFHVENNRNKLEEIIPSNPMNAFDIHQAIEVILDQKGFLEIRPKFAPEVVTGYGTVDGVRLSIVANNSTVNGGLIFPDAARKIARHISLAAVYRLPIVFFVDTGGFMIGSQAEKNSIMNAAAALFIALENCTSPKLSIVLRRGYSAGLYAMAGPGFADQLAALPNSKLGIVSSRLSSKMRIEKSTTIPQPISPESASDYEILKPENVSSYIKEFATNPKYAKKWRDYELVMPR